MCAISDSNLICNYDESGPIINGLEMLRFNRLSIALASGDGVKPLSCGFKIISCCTPLAISRPRLILSGLIVLTWSLPGLVKTLGSEPNN